MILRADLGVTEGVEDEIEALCIPTNDDKTGQFISSPLQIFRQFIKVQ